ncbi:MAG: hypothetical protein ACLQE9_04165 [Roseiarcus sp.]
MKGLYNGWAVVGRSVIDGDDLYIRQRLREEALDRFRNESLLLIDRNDDRNDWFVGHAVTRRLKSKDRHHTFFAFSHEPAKAS